VSSSDNNSNFFSLFSPADSSGGVSEYGSVSSTKQQRLYDDPSSNGDRKAGRSVDSYARDSVELRVSKRAFDCPEVDFWNGSHGDEDDELKITTSAPTFEQLEDDDEHHLSSTIPLGVTRASPSGDLASPSSSIQNKKRRLQHAGRGGGSSGEASSVSTMILRDNEYPDFVAPVEWRMIRNEITKDLKAGEWAFDCNTLEMWWSVEIFRIFNLDHKYAKPSFASYKKLLHPDDKDLVLFLFQRALEKGVPYEVSHRFTMLDDKVKWCRVKCRVQLDSSKSSVTKLFGTIQDITLWSKSVIDGRKVNNIYSA